MLYNPIPCTQERLIPTRWIIGEGYPGRSQVAAHLRGLRRDFGAKTALECRRRMIWIGIFPVDSMRNKEN